MGCGVNDFHVISCSICFRSLHPTPIPGYGWTGTRSSVVVEYYIRIASDVTTTTLLLYCCLPCFNVESVVCHRLKPVRDWVVRERASSPTRLLNQAFFRPYHTRPLILDFSAHPYHTRPLLRYRYKWVLQRRQAITQQTLQQRFFFARCFVAAGNQSSYYIKLSNLGSLRRTMRVGSLIGYLLLGLRNGSGVHRQDAARNRIGT